MNIINSADLQLTFFGSVSHVAFVVVSIHFFRISFISHADFYHSGIAIFFSFSVNIEK